MRTALALALLAFAANAHAASPVRTCAERADSDSANPADSPRPDDVFVGHRILLVGLQASKVRDTAGDTPGWYWFKALAVVRTGRRVTISIPRAQRDRLRLQYGHDRRSLTFAPCADRKWTYFPGGFMYSKPGCYAVDVRIAGKPSVRRRFPLGAGATCPT
jgi:hypothetical protein